MALQFLMRNTTRCQYLMSSLHYSSFSKQLEYKKCYKILGIAEDSDQEQIRSAYLSLAKRYHPDSGNEEADAEKFSEIDKAFRLLIEKKSKERWDVDDSSVTVEEQDIKHTAPQHRQYLSYDGVGSGNPFQRQKQYTKYRAMQAAENVLQHRMSKVTADDKALLDKLPLKHKIKTKYGFERLVEDLIQEAISKGEFNNLSGTGKPLPDHQSTNPYVDFVTRKLNEVLIDNGFTPEWITLQKEIRDEIKSFRRGLLAERSYFGPFPLSVEDNIDWSECVYKFEKLVMQINRKIDKFNLVVPIINKQMVRLCLEKEAQKALINGSTYEDSGYTKQQNNDSRNIKVQNEEGSHNLFGFIEYLFKKS